MLVRIRHIHITPYAMLPAGAAVVGYIPGVSEIGHALEKGYNAAKSALNKIGDAFESAGKWIGENVGAGGKWLWEHDPIMQLGYKIAKGENVWQALKEVGAIIGEDIRIFGPYLAYIPGVGTAAAMAIAAGLALANGKSLTEIAIETMRGAIPPGPFLTAFDTANALLHGKSITEAALEALHKEYPAAYDVAKAAIDVAKGGSISEAALSVIRDQLPPEAQFAMDAGIAIAKGKRVQDALLDGVRAALPPDYQEAFDVARDVANGKNLVDVAIAEAKRHLPPEAQAYADVAIALIKGAKVSDVLIQAARAAIPAEYLKYFDMAMSLKSVDASTIIAAVKAQVPANTPIDQVYAIAKNLQTTGAATGGMRAVVRGNSIAFEARPHIALGGLFPTRPPQYRQVSVGAGAIVNAALNIAIEELRRQLPSEPAAQAAFQAAVDLVKGKSVEDVAIEVSKSFVPQEYQDAYGKAAKVADDVIHGASLGDVGMDAIRANLPDGAAGYADLALRFVQGEKSTDAALAAARLLLPANAQGAFDLAMSLAGQGASFRPAAIGAVKAGMTAGQDLNTAFDQAVSLAKAQIPQSFIDDLKEKAAIGDDLKAAFDQVIELAKGKAVQSIATEIVKGYIPDDFKASYQKVADFANQAPTSDAALNVFRQKVSPAGQHVVDSATALFKGAAPENIASDAMIQDVVARVAVYQKSVATYQKIAPYQKIAVSRTDVPSPILANVSRLRTNILASVHGDSDPASDPLRSPDLVVVVPPSEEDWTAYNQALEDIARRRAALGQSNPYLGSPLDPDFQKAIDAKTAQYQAEMAPKINARRFLRLKGAVEDSAEGAVEESAEGATKGKSTIKTVALVAGGGALAYYLIRRRRHAP